MTRRIEHIDVARGLGILLVVIGHNPLVADMPNPLFDVIYAFHIPLFFFLSGLFFKPEQPFLSLVARRTDMLLKPYAVVLLALAAFQVMFRHRDPELLLAGILYGAGDTIAWIPMWFLPHLWILSISAWLMLRLVPTKRILGRAALLAALLITGVALSSYFATHPWYPLSAQQPVLGLPLSADLLPLSCFYFLLGTYCRQRTLEMTFSWKLLLACVMGSVLLHLIWGGTIDLNMRRYDHPLVLTALALLGTYGVLQLSCLATRYPLALRVLSYVGTGTLFILIFHAYIQTAVFNGLMRWQAEHSLLNAALAFAAGVLLPLVLWEGVKRSRLLSRLLLPRTSPQVNA